MRSRWSVQSSLVLHQGRTIRLIDESRQRDLTLGVDRVETDRARPVKLGCIPHPDQKRIGRGPTRAGRECFDLEIERRNANLERGGLRPIDEEDIAPFDPNRIDVDDQRAVGRVTRLVRGNIAVFSRVVRWEQCTKIQLTGFIDGRRKPGRDQQHLFEDDIGLKESEQ